MKAHGKKTIYGILVLIVILGIFFLTFQSAESSAALSESFNHFLADHGVKLSSKEVRSLAHIPEYFIFGLCLAVFGNNNGWKTWSVTLIGCTLGLVDETIKAILPWKHFEITDWFRDICGLLIAVGIVQIMSSIQKKQ